MIKKDMSIDKRLAELAGYMNHKLTENTNRMEKIEKNIFTICEKQIKTEYDLKWIKKIMTIQTTLLIGLFISLIGVMFSMIFGG